MRALRLISLETELTLGGRYTTETRGCKRPVKAVARVCSVAGRKVQTCLSCKQIITHIGINLGNIYKANSKCMRKTYILKSVNTS